MGDIAVKGHILKSYKDGIYVDFYPGDKRDYLRNIWQKEISKVFDFEPKSKNNIVITGYSQYFNEKDAFIAYGEVRVIEERPYVHLHVLVLDIDEYKKANYNIFSTDAKFISYENFIKNEISWQRELRVNKEARESRPIDVDTLINNWISGKRIFYTDDPVNLINALARRIGGNFTYVVDLSPKEPYPFDIIIYRGTSEVADVRPRQVIMDYVERVKYAESIFKFVDIFQFLRRLNVEMDQGKSYQEALVEFIGSHCRQIKASVLYYVLRDEFGERAYDVLNRILMRCPNSHEFINDPDFIRAISEIRDYPNPPLRDLIEHVKKQERDKEWYNYVKKWNGDYREAYEQLNRIYPSFSEVLDKFNELLTERKVNIETVRKDLSLSRILELIYNKIRSYDKDPLRQLLIYVKVTKQHDVTENELREIISYLTDKEREELIVKYLRGSKDEAKYYLNLFDKKEIMKIIDAKIRNKDGLLIIGCNIHDYIDKNTKCFYLLLQWIKTNNDMYAYVYRGKVKHAFDDLLKTKKRKFWGLLGAHVDLSDLERENEEVIDKIEKLSDILEEKDRKYIQEELGKLKKKKK